MAAPARFTFDLDMGGGTPRPAGLTPEAADLRAEDARKAGYAEGLAEGTRKADLATARKLADATARLASGADALLADVRAGNAERTQNAVALAASIARKLAGHLIAREPQAELEALLVECLASLDQVPHLVIRCHPDLVETLTPLAAARADTSHFAGRLVVLGDPDIALGDGRIEWADGGLVRDTAEIDLAIEAAINTYLAARAPQ